MNIYVASSWRNVHQPLIVELLCEWGCEVYDFRHPPHGRGGFAWSDIDAAWQRWTPAQWREALRHPLAIEGLAADTAGMERADACVCVLPCGRSAHLELGWFAGKGRPTCVLATEPVEPDLMVGLCDYLATSHDELRDWVECRIEATEEEYRDCAGDFVRSPKVPPPPKPAPENIYIAEGSRRRFSKDGRDI